MAELQTYPDALSLRPWMAPKPTEGKTVSRTSGPISIDALLEVLDRFMQDNQSAVRSARPATDGSLSPLVHSALRLTRREASDKGIWAWLASGPGRAYTLWRWQGQDGVIAQDRWFGDIHKQSLARLWWGAELFRDGPIYSQYLFRHQDIPNSIIHRTFVRNRPLAVSVESVLRAKYATDAPDKTQLRDWFAAINLYAGAMSLDSLGLLYRSDNKAYEAWMAQQPPGGFPVRPVGPQDGQVSEKAKKRAVEFLNRVWDGAVAGPSSRGVA